MIEEFNVDSKAECVQLNLALTWSSAFRCGRASFPQIVVYEVCWWVDHRHHRIYFTRI